MMETENHVKHFLKLDLALPPGLVLRWLGTAVLISAEGTTQCDDKREKLLVY